MGYNGNMYDTPLSTDEPTIDRDRDALAPSPSTGWRGVYRVMGVAL